VTIVQKAEVSFSVLRPVHSKKGTLRIYSVGGGYKEPQQPAWGNQPPCCEDNGALIASIGLDDQTAPGGAWKRYNLDVTELFGASKPDGGSLAWPVRRRGGDPIHSLDSTHSSLCLSSASMHPF
jgi:hypothetical protein